MNTKFISPLLLAIFLALLGGCAQSIAVSKPYLLGKDNWKIIEDCGSEGCYPLADYLIGNSTRIRIDSTNHFDDQIFTITLSFSSKEDNTIYFNPSLTEIKLSNGKIIPAKPFPCKNSIRNLQFLRKRQPITKPIRIGNIFCFYLFFDVNPPSINDEFELMINGVTIDGLPANIPTIYFKKWFR